GCRFQASVDDMKAAWIVATGLVLNCGHAPARRRCAIEKQCETRIRWRKRLLEMVAEPLRERGTREHRVRRANGREKRRAGHVGVHDMMEARVLVSNRTAGAHPHSKRSRFVVRGAQAIAAFVERQHC